MTLMRVGIEVSRLRPNQGGLFTYTSQLLSHLTQLAEAPALTLLDGSPHSTLPQLLHANGGSLPPARYARIRTQPLIRSLWEPWGKRYPGAIMTMADECLLKPLWDSIHGMSALGPKYAKWLLPGTTLDVCHWPFEDTFVRSPLPAHVVTIHDTIVLRFPEWHDWLYVADHTRKLRLIARHATRLIADSENTRRDVVDLLGVDPGRIDVVPLAAGPEFCPPVAHDSYLRVLARYGLHEGAYIFSMGIISHRKNVVRLAGGFKTAVERRPELPTKLVLAGGLGWKTEPIERGLREVGLGDRMVMLGRVPQEDLPALLHGARAVAYLSLYEGFGLPPLEAMACGAAVVASNTSSLPEVVGDAGLLVDPYDVGAIAGALERVLMDDVLRAELAARGLRRAAEFSWAKTARLTMETYQHAVATHRRALST